MRDENKIRELSRRLAEACGLRPMTPAGELTDASGRLLWQWFKCPKHGTWLQCCFCSGGHPHWHCSAINCPFMKAAKMRTKIERDLFRLAKYMEEKG
jgi:hypothetical protein